MGLIRKSLKWGTALGTGVPLVRGDSKKQRNARKLLAAQQETNRLLAEQLAAHRRQQG